MLQLNILISKTTSKLLKLLNLGSGYTWPGHIALKLNNSFIRDIVNKNPDLKVIIVAGTNGKTTTSLMIKQILSSNKFRVLHNQTGANLRNGIASLLALNSNASGKLNYDVLILEIDENTLPLIVRDTKPNTVLILNLFRDQLDRYGEVNIIYDKWKKSLESLPKNTNIILNADDPMVSSLVTSASYFSLTDQKAEQRDHSMDSIICPNCSNELKFNYVNYSHLGDWECPKCGLKKPKSELNSLPSYPLSGTYNKYNSIASVLVAEKFGINNNEAAKSLSDIKPAFGRQEEVIYKDKKIKLFLSKNPTSFNESIRTIMNQDPKAVLFVLNDRIPDGTDVSWIWDTELENQNLKNVKLITSGDRYLDMAVRLKYALLDNSLTINNLTPEKNLDAAINTGLNYLSKNETLYILPTYSAMLETRKIITGKKIL